VEEGVKAASRKGLAMVSPFRGFNAQKLPQFLMVAAHELSKYGLLLFKMKSRKCRQKILIFSNFLMLIASNSFLFLHDKLSR